EQSQIAPRPDLHVVRLGLLLDPGQIAVGSAGIYHQPIGAAAASVDKQIIEHAAALVEHAAIEGGAIGGKLGSIVGEQPAQEGEALRSVEIDGQHMGDVEDTAVATDPAM